MAPGELAPWGMPEDQAGCPHGVRGPIDQGFPLLGPSAKKATSHPQHTGLQNPSNCFSILSASLSIFSPWALDARVEKQAETEHD